ncbi:DNA-binding transcriptional repressor MarR [compost metagenome]
MSNPHVKRYSGGMKSSEPTYASPPPHAEDPCLAEIERAMIALRRSMSRRTLGKRMVTEHGKPLDMSLVAVVDAVEQSSDTPESGVTVGEVAERLGIDPSRGSRVVSAAIEAGYVRRQASQHDGRRIVLELTDEGAALAEAAHRMRQQAFEDAMRDWSAADREAFAGLLSRFVSAYHKT